ncbi:MAG: peptidylprolyl isomerase [Alphaproteobacteria bacterium]|nr:MAG: peptidylprolyl isomerase [Alphaproteobacteria bacterium]
MMSAKTITPGIQVNDVHISAEEINNEVQYHPADSLPEAKYQAMQALVVRELLLQKAVSCGICTKGQAVKDSDEVIERLLKQKITVPEPDAETCRRYYEANKARFYTSPLFQVSHILYLAPPENEQERKKARRKAAAALKRIQKDPNLFPQIAKEESDCSSSGEGGRLGQISKGQTLPAFEAVLLKMRAGEMSDEPVATEVGYHIIQVHEYAEGRQLPYDAVSDWIADFLKNQSWQRAVSQYIQILAGEAKISGFRLKAADTPLVQ